MTEPILHQLEEMLRDAAARRTRAAEAGSSTPEPAAPPEARAAAGRPIGARRRRRRRALSPRRAGVLALTAVLLAGTALAAAPVWEPIIGDSTRGHPSSTTQAPPAQELALLAALRRPQSGLDRSIEVENELRLVGTQAKGVRTRYIRYLGQAPGGGVVVLVPSEAFGNGAGLTAPATTTDALCVLFPFSATTGHPRGAAYPCWTAAELRNGTAVATVATGVGRYVFGIVPDGVTTVDAFFGASLTASTTVSSNFFAIRILSTAGHSGLLSAIDWRDAAGDVISQFHP